MLQDKSIENSNLEHITLESGSIAADNPLFGQFFEILEMGGPVMLILLSMSIFALSVFIFKLIQFQYAGIYSFKKIDAALAEWKKGHYNNTINQLELSRNPAARVMQSACTGIHKNFDPTLIREEVARIANANMESLRGYFRVIEVIASLSPLLGLFGTVLGIIDAFHELEKAGSNIDPSMLSGGIRVALLTTAAGLAVGMPAIAALNWLESKLDRFIHLTENAVTQVFTHSLAVYQKQGQDNTESRGSDFYQENTSRESYAQ